MTDEAANPDLKKRLLDSTYASEYPMNRVTVTESGHEFHWDDTKGKERIRIAHMNGSYMEWSSDGRKVELITDNHVKYVKGGETFTVDKNVDHKYNGSVRQSIHGHSHQEFLGTHSQAIGMNHKVMVGMNQTTAVNGNHTLGVTGDAHHTFGGDATIKFDGKMTQIADKSTSHQFGADYTKYSVGDMTHKTDGKMTHKAASDITIQTGGTGNLA